MRLLSPASLRNALLLSVGCASAGAQTAPADASLQAAVELYRAGNCPDAVRQLASSKAPRALLLSARCYLDLADFVKAKAALLQYNQAVPNDENGQLLLARALTGGGESAQAVAALEDLRKRVPTSLGVQDALADAYSQSGKAAQAALLYRAVLAVQPSDVAALAGLASLDAAAGQWQAAVDQYKQALDLSPDHVQALIGLGQAQLQLGQSSAAIGNLQHAWKLRPDDWALTRILAGCYVKESKWPETIQTLAFNSLAHASDEETTSWMVQAFGRTADARRAEQYYRAVLQRSAANFSARLALANLLWDANRHAEAKEHYLLVSRAKPNLAEVNDRIGQIAEQENDTAEAIRYYTLACQASDATVAMKMRLASLYFHTRDMAHARPVLEAILQAEPSNRDVKMMLVQAAAETGKTDDAIRYATELLPRDPNNPTLLRLLGDNALKHGEDAKGAEFLERALAAEPKDRDLRFQLATLYTNNDVLDKLPRAFELMNEYVGLNPDDYEGYLVLANLYRRKSDAANAHAYFTKGFGLMPVKPPARLSWAYNSLGLLLLSEGKYEDAMNNQLQAAELNPSDATAVYNLALTYLKLKKRDEVNATRDKLRIMGSMELLSALDEQIQRSRINEGK